MHLARARPTDSICMSLTPVVCLRPSSPLQQNADRPTWMNADAAMHYERPSYAPLCENSVIGLLRIPCVWLSKIRLAAFWLGVLTKLRFSARNAGTSDRRLTPSKTQPFHSLQRPCLSTSAVSKRRSVCLAKHVQHAMKCPARDCVMTQLQCHALHCKIALGLPLHFTLSKHLQHVEKTCVEVDQCRFG